MTYNSHDCHFKHEQVKVAAGYLKTVWFDIPFTTLWIKILNISYDIIIILFVKMLNNYILTLRNI